METAQDCDLDELCAIETIELEIFQDNLKSPISAKSIAGCKEFGDERLSYQVRIAKCEKRLILSAI